MWMHEARQYYVEPISSLTTTVLQSTPPSLPLPTSTLPDPGSGQQPLSQGDNGAPTSIVINISDAGSTGRGILIGVLSAFGSAGIAVLVLAVFFFFKYTNRGRIILDRIGRPGEYDDEQAFAREEAEALETMDELQRAEYLRAKGNSILFCNVIWIHANRHLYSVCSGEPSGNGTDRYFVVAVPRDTGERSLGMGIRA
jgi:hypothetical protein